MKALRSNLFHAALFYPVLIFAGACNSFEVAATPAFRAAFAGSAAVLALYFSFVVARVASERHRLIFLVGILVCAFGENFCVHVLELYHFAGQSAPPYGIPPYVILG